MTTPVVVRKGELTLLLARLITKAMLALVVVFLFGTVQGARHGMSAEYGLLMLGSVLSMASLFANTVTVQAEKGRRSWLLGLAAASGFIPYLFGVYLVGYRGLWTLTGLAGDFSFLLLVKATTFLVLGYAVVMGIYRLSEFQRQVSGGAVVLLE